MKRFLGLLTLSIAALSLMTSGASIVNGCASAYPYPCHYNATDAGDIVGVGDWKVEVWWDGECAGDPDWTVSSVDGSPSNPGPGNNAPGGLAGSWEDSIAIGSCAVATPLSPGSAVVVGNIEGVGTE